jgi:SAM-dependent methyltransferase
MGEGYQVTIWDERYKTGEGLRWWPNEELVRFLGKTYGDMRKVPCIGKHALELGCGTGCNLIALTAFGFFAHGMDASDDALQVAQEYVNSWALDANAQYGVSKIVLPSTLHLANGSMDLAVDCQTIQHLSEEDHVKVYAEVARARMDDALDVWRCQRDLCGRLPRIA